MTNQIQHEFNERGLCWCNPIRIYVPEKEKYAWVHRNNTTVPIETAAQAVRERILNG